MIKGSQFAAGESASHIVLTIIIIRGDALAENAGSAPGCSTRNKDNRNSR